MCYPFFSLGKAIPDLPNMQQVPTAVFTDQKTTSNILQEELNILLTFPRLTCHQSMNRQAKKTMLLFIVMVAVLVMVDMVLRLVLVFTGDQETKGIKIDSNC